MANPAWSISQYRPPTPARTAPVPAPTAPRAAPAGRMTAYLNAYRAQQGAAAPVAPFKPRKHTDGPPSLLSQVKRTVYGVPQGVANLITSAAVTGAAIPRLGIDAVTGRLGEQIDAAGGWNGRAIYDQDQLGAQSIAYLKAQGIDPAARTGGFRQFAHEYVPLPTQFYESMGEGTLPRVYGALHADYSGYQAASAEGRIFDVGLEDIGNIATIGSFGGGKVLGALSAESKVPSMALRSVLEEGTVARNLGAAAAESLPADTIAAPRFSVTEMGEVKPMETTARIPGRGIAGYLERQAVEKAGSYEAAQAGGYLDSARRVAAAGHRIEQVSRLGESVGDVGGFSWPVKGLSYLARKSGLPELAGRGIGSWATRTVERGGGLAKLAERLTPEWRSTVSEALNARASLGRELTANERRLLYARKLQESAGLSQSEARASTFAVDERFLPLVDTFRDAVDQGLDPSVMEAVIQRAYPNLPDALRPTVEDVQAFVDWKDQRLDDTHRYAMDRIERTVRDNSEVLTSQEQQLGLLDDEQLGNEYLTQPLESIRKGYELNRQRDQSKVDRQFKIALRAQRMADVNDALATPDPAPAPRPLLETGRRAGVLEERAAGARREHTKAQRDVERAASAYIKAEQAGESNVVLERLGNELDRASQRAEAIREEVSKLDRRRQAADPLSKIRDRITEDAQVAERPDPRAYSDHNVTAVRNMGQEIRDRHSEQARGYVESLTGGEQLQTPPSNPADRGAEWNWWEGVAGRSHIYQREGFLTSKYEHEIGGSTGMAPGPFADGIRQRIGQADLSDAQAFDMYVKAVNEYRQAQLAGDPKATAAARERLDAISGGTRVQVPARVMHGAKTWKALPKKLREALIQEGYVARPGKRTVVEAGEVRGLRPDQFAQNMSDRLGRDLSVDEAMDMYFSAVDNYLDAKATGGDVAVGELADQLGIPEEAVRVAMSGTADDFRNAMRETAVGALDEMQTAFQTADPAMAQGLLDEMQSMRESGASGDEIGAYVEDALGAAGADVRGILTPIWTSVDWNDVADWLTGREISPAIWETVVGKRGAVQERFMGRLQQQQIDARGRLADTNQDYRELSTLYGVAQRQIDRDTRRAAKGIEDAASAQERAATASVKANTEEAAFVAKVDEAKASGQGWQRRDVNKKEVQAIKDDPNLTPRQKQYRIDAVENPLAPHERLMVRKGALRDRALARAAAVRKLERSAARWNEKIELLPTELARGFVSRLVEDVNAPAIKSVKTKLRQTAKPLGGIVEGAKDADPTVNGLMGRLANKYGITDEVIAALDEETQWAATQDGLQPLDGRRAFQRALDENGIVLDHVDSVDLEMSTNVDQMLHEIGQIEADMTGNGLLPNLPLRVRDYFNAHRMERMIPDDVVSQIDKRFEQYLVRRNKHLETAMDNYTAVMPGRYRAVAINARRDVRGLLDEAEARWQAGDTETASALIGLAEDVPTTLQQLVASGIDPTHLTGGEAPTIAPSLGGTGISIRGMRGTEKLTTGLRPVDLSGVIRLEISESNKLIINRTADLLKAKTGRRVDDVIGDEIATWKAEHPFDDYMPAREIEQRLRAAGYVAATGEAGPPHGGTVAVPLAVADEMRAYNNKPGAIWQTIHTGNRLFKMSVLPFSPKWHLGNIVGNAFMAMSYGRLGPLELARTMDYIAKQQGGWREFYRNGGLPTWAPDDLATHGFTYNEHVLRWGDDGLAGVDEIDQPGRVREHFDRIVAGSYNINEFFDNATRSAVYLSGLKKGLSTEQAMRHSLKAMGDFTRMSPFERRWLREAFPFYSWMRHQTQAALRMPLYAPTRAAWLLHVTNMMNDPEYGPEMLALLGSKMNVAGTWINAGGLSPFANPIDLPLDPTGPSLFSALTPTVKFPFQLATGSTIGLGGIKAISRPTAQKGTGLYGETVGVSPLRRLLSDPVHAAGEIAYSAAEQFPQTKLLRDLALDATGGKLGEFRYKSGDRGPSEYDKPRSLAETIAGGLGVPWQNEGVSIDELLKQQRDNERAARRRARG